MLQIEDFDSEQLYAVKQNNYTVKKPKEIASSFKQEQIEVYQNLSLVLPSQNSREEARKKNRLFSIK